MATKYVSSLTGSEMDSALLDMAYHNSEAYAVGTRNGVEVGSGDVTYHNNSKYWAEQVYGYTDRAEDAANRAEAAVPSGTAGAVFFDRAQTLTKNQQAQARANIMAGGSNRNLLDNPFFTVNQRGVSGTISTANAYTVDRWKLSAGSVTISANGVSLLKVGSTQGSCRQYIEYDRIKTNEQYTLSVMLQSGEVYSVTGTLTPQTVQSGWIISRDFTTDLWGGIRAYGANAELWDVCFTSNNTSGVAIRAVKLELGSVSTLANDAPPDYGTELLKCQRYFRRITNIGRGRLFIGVGFSGGVEVPSIFGVGNEMRKTTSLTVTYSGSFVINAGTDIAVTNITKNENNSNFGLSFTASGITPYTLYSILGSAGAYIDISADL